MQEKFAKKQTDAEAELVRKLKTWERFWLYFFFKPHLFSFFRQTEDESKMISKHHQQQLEELSNATGAEDKAVKEHKQFLESLVTTFEQKQKEEQISFYQATYAKLLDGRSRLMNNHDEIFK